MHQLMDFPHKRLPRVLLEPLRPCCLCITRAHGLTFSDTDVTLWNLHTTINRKCPTILTGSVSVLYDNTCTMQHTLHAMHSRVLQSASVTVCRFCLAEDIEAVAVQGPRIPWLVHQCPWRLFLPSLNWFHFNSVSRLFRYPSLTFVLNFVCYF
jgi:hypothetical protein